MPKHVYPATFTPEGGGYNVDFPDIDGCYTSGTDLQDAVEMAEDVLAFVLCEKEERGEPLPTPSELENVKPKQGGFAALIRCNTDNYPLGEIGGDTQIKTA